MYFRTQMRLDIIPEENATRTGTHCASSALSAGFLSVVVSTYCEMEIGQTVDEPHMVADTDLHTGR